MATRIRVELAAVGIKWRQPGGKWRQPDGMVAASEWNSYTPCILDFLMAKDFKASTLHVSELSIALPWIPNNSPQSQICFGDKKAIKTPKLNTFFIRINYKGP